MLLPWIWPVMIAPADVQGWDCGELVDSALRMAGISRKCAALTMDTPEASLSRQIAGCGPEHLSLHRLTRLPARFWVVFVLLLGVRYGPWPGWAEMVADVVRRGKERASGSAIQLSA